MKAFSWNMRRVGERLMGQNRLSRWGHRQFDTFRVWRAHIMTFQENFQLTWAKTKSASRYGRPWEESMITHALVMVAYGGINDNTRARDDKATKIWQPFSLESHLFALEADTVNNAVGLSMSRYLKQNGTSKSRFRKERIWYLRRFWLLFIIRFYSTLQWTREWIISCTR